jgi:hypothetical protein
MSDNSFIGAAGLVLRPFFEELDGNWRTIKGICVASLIVAISMWIFSALAYSSQFAKARLVLNTTGWFGLLVFLFSYGMIYWELHLRDKEKEEARHKKVKAFTDVDKR